MTGTLIGLGLSLLLAVGGLVWLSWSLGSSQLADQQTIRPIGIDPFAIDEADDQDPQAILSAIASLKLAEEYARANSNQRVSRVNLSTHVRRTGSTAQSALRRVR